LPQRALFQVKVVWCEPLARQFRVDASKAELLRSLFKLYPLQLLLSWQSSDFGQQSPTSLPNFFVLHMLLIPSSLLLLLFAHHILVS
jgi:hypothetical protein